MNTMTQDTSTGLWNNKNRKIFFWSILALAVILRCIRFATVPDGINQDEAMGAVDAWHYQNTEPTDMVLFCRFILLPGDTVR